MSHGATDKCEPNFVPLLDLVLQLVMFFMLCANFVLDQTNVQIKLPEAISAKALDKAEDYTIYLNINEQGIVILAPTDQFKGTDEQTVKALDNPKQVEIWLKRRYEEDIQAGGPANKDKGPRSLIVLRVHKQCPWGKTHTIMAACRAAGYSRAQLRVELHSGPI